MSRIKYSIAQTDYGIIGVAWASLIAMTLFNIIKLYFIQMKFKIVPFDKGYLKLILVVLLIGVALYFVPRVENNIANLLVKSGLYCVITVFAVYKFKLVYSLNFWVRKVLKIN